MHHVLARGDQSHIRENSIGAARSKRLAVRRTSKVVIEASGEGDAVCSVEPSDFEEVEENVFDPSIVCVSLAQSISVKSEREVEKWVRSMRRMWG